MSVCGALEINTMNRKNTYHFEYVRLSPTVGDCSSACICLENETVKAHSFRDAIDVLADAFGVSGYVSSHNSYTVTNNHEQPHFD